MNSQSTVARLSVPDRKTRVVCGPAPRPVDAEQSKHARLRRSRERSRNIIREDKNEDAKPRKEPRVDFTPHHPACGRTDAGGDPTGRTFFSVIRIPVCC